jgi:hypothetical protein
LTSKNSKNYENLGCRYLKKTEKTLLSVCLAFSPLRCKPHIFPCERAPR